MMNWSECSWQCVCDEQLNPGGYNMALDEILLTSATRPILRVYGWSKPTVSFGYFEKIDSVRTSWEKVEFVRRWTGGGQVDHRSDFTYTVIIPAGEGGKLPMAREAYCWIHKRVAAALRSAGFDAKLADADAHVPNGPCFVKPVAADVMINSVKVAGAAQRRNHLGMLHQGSLQGLEFPSGWREKFLAEFPVDGCSAPDSTFREEALILTREKYDTAEWLNRF